MKGYLKSLRVSPQSLPAKVWKQDSQTYVKFAREKEALFDSWCMAKQVDKDYHKLRLLVEEFKTCLQSDVKMYLNEQKADNLHQAAVLADDYSLTHRSAFSTFEQPVPGLSVSENDGKTSAVDKQSLPVTSSRHQRQGRSYLITHRKQQEDQFTIIVNNMATSWQNVEHYH